MRYLRQSTAARISVGPFLDVTDGVTPETALTVTNDTCEMFVSVDGTTAVARTQLSLTASGGSNDMVHVASDTCGMYDLELTTTNTATCGRMRLMIYDTDVHLPVFEEFTILPAKVYDSLILGTDNLETDLISIGGLTTLNAKTLLDQLNDFLAYCYDSTANTVAVPSSALTPPDNFSAMVIDANGRIDVGKVLGNDPMTAGDVNAEMTSAITDAGVATASTLASVDAKVDIIDTNVDTLDTLIDSLLGVDFSTTTDNIHVLAAVVSSLEISSVAAALDEIKGTGFLKDTHSLVNLTGTGGPGSVIGD